MLQLSVPAQPSTFVKCDNFKAGARILPEHAIKGFDSDMTGWRHGKTVVHWSWVGRRRYPFLKASPENSSRPSKTEPQLKRTWYSSLATKEQHRLIL